MFRSMLRDLIDKSFSMPACPHPGLSPSSKKREGKEGILLPHGLALGSIPGPTFAPRSRAGQGNPSPGVPDPNCKSLSPLQRTTEGSFCSSSLPPDGHPGFCRHTHTHRDNQKLYLQVRLFFSDLIPLQLVSWMATGWNLGRRRPRPTDASAAPVP